MMANQEPKSLEESLAILKTYKNNIIEDIYQKTEKHIRDFAIESMFLDDFDIRIAISTFMGLLSKEELDLIVDRQVHKTIKLAKG
jgi:hypothetical protein